MATPVYELERSIDQSIDGILRWIGQHLKLLLIVAIIAAVFYTFLLPIWEVWLPLVGTVLQFVLYMLWLAGMMIFQFVVIFWFIGRPKTYWVFPGETGVTFADYKGNPEVLEGARRVVTLLRSRMKFKEMGGEPIRGLLLIGPPGTGKSYLAQAISTEAGVPFGYISAASIRGIFWGMDVMQIWNLYRKARKNAQKYGACILFIDEIDAIGASRMSQGPGAGFGGFMFGGGSGALNQLLLEMDPPPQDNSLVARLFRRLGIRRKKAERPVILTIGATNIPDVLDPALLRPGRFDRKIVVDHPDADGRREIIEYYLSKVKHDEMPIDKMVSDTIGYTPVVIKYVINEAVVLAHFDGRDRITYQDFTRAREVHEWGLRQPIKSMSREEKRRLAYHEAGHAFAQIKLLPHERFTKVTIIRHGQALGLSATKPITERWTQTREELLADMQVSLASRAAEEVFLGTTLTGVTQDLASATQLATAYIGWFGFNGNLYSTRAFGEIAPDAYMKEQIERLLQDQYKKVKTLIELNRDIVQAIAEALLEREELDGDETLEIVRRVEAQRPFRPLNGHLGESIGFLAAARRAAQNGHSEEQAATLPVALPAPEGSAAQAPPLRHEPRHYRPIPFSQ